MITLGFVCNLGSDCFFLVLVSSSELLQPSVLFESLRNLTSMSITLDLIKVCFCCCFGDEYELNKILNYEKFFY